MDAEEIFTVSLVVIRTSLHLNKLVTEQQIVFFLTLPWKSIIALVILLWSASVTFVLGTHGH